MISQIAELLIVLFFITMAFIHKINIFDFFMEEKGEKLSSRRLGMFVCIWLLVWLVKTIAIAETVDKWDMLLVGFIGVLAFAPRLLDDIVAKVTYSFSKKVE